MHLTAVDWYIFLNVSTDRDQNPSKCEFQIRGDVTTSHSRDSGVSDDGGSSAVALRKCAHKLTSPEG